MGQLLERAIEEARRLPEEDQEALGWLMLEEIDSERKWDELFSRPPSPALERMMDEALDYRAGRTEPLDPDKI